MHQTHALVPGKRNSEDTSDLSPHLPFSSPAPSPGPGLLLLGSVIRTLAQTVSVGWHCFGAQWLELARVQSWHHRPWARQGTGRVMTRGTQAWTPRPCTLFSPTCCSCHGRPMPIDEFHSHKTRPKGLQADPVAVSAHPASPILLLLHIVPSKMGGFQDRKGPPDLIGSPLDL